MPFTIFSVHALFLKDAVSHRFVHSRVSRHSAGRLSFDAVSARLCMRYTLQSSRAGACEKHKGPVLPMKRKAVPFQERTYSVTPDLSDTDRLFAKRSDPVSHGVEGTIGDAKVNLAMIVCIFLAVQEAVLRHSVDVAK